MELPGPLVNLRNCKIVFQDNSTIIHSQQRWMRVQISQHSCQHLLVSVFHFILAIQVGVKQYLTMILIGVSQRLMTLRSFSYAYWPILYFLCRNVHSDLVPIFKLGYLHIVKLQIFPFILWLPFLWSTNVFNFWYSLIYLHFFCCVCVLCHI